MSDFTFLDDESLLRRRLHPRKSTGRKAIAIVILFTLTIILPISSGSIYWLATATNRQKKHDEDEIRERNIRQADELYAECLNKEKRLIKEMSALYDEWDRKTKDGKLQPIPERLMRVLDEEYVNYAGMEALIRARAHFNCIRKGDEKELLRIKEQKKRTSTV